MHPCSQTLNLLLPSFPSHHAPHSCHPRGPGAAPRTRKVLLLVPLRPPQRRPQLLLPPPGLLRLALLVLLLPCRRLGLPPRRLQSRP